MARKTPHDSHKHLPPVKASQRGKQPSGKPIRANSKTGVPLKKQLSEPRSPLNGCLVALGAIAIIFASGGLVVGGTWLAIRLMIDPNTVLWLNQFLPAWTRIPVAASSAPQTLAAIQDKIRQSGLIAGEPQALNSELLLPILALKADCQTDCEQIVELRVYQPTGPSGNETYYQLVTELPIVGPEEYFVLSTPVSARADDAGVSRSLPLTKLTRFDSKAPGKGFCFNLSGHQSTGDTPMTYGQIIHYNPDQMHLSIMLQWTSPNESQPYWQEITGGSSAELVVDRMVGLEPQFKVYQVKPRKFVPNPIYLEEISLAQPALYTPAYRNGMTLARHGLWSPAQQWLKSQKSKKWSTTAQAQLDFVQLHAQVTEAQSKQPWATPSQQILAKLIDGRWADALLVFQGAAPGSPVQEIATFLKNDPGDLWERVEAALKVNPNDENVKAWGALILTAQQNRAKAIAWLRQMTFSNTFVSTAETFTLNYQFYELLDHLEGTFTNASGGDSSKIVGTARLVQKPNSTDWLPPANKNTGLAIKNVSSQSSTLQLEPQQVWYQVQVGAFNDGQRWKQSPFSDLPLPTIAYGSQLWHYLGLGANSRIQITGWTAQGTQESTIATVKAAVYRGGTLQLLAAGEPLVSATQGTANKTKLLAYTESSLRWLEPVSISLWDLNQLQPQWVSTILPVLWRELLKSGQLKSGAFPSLTAMLSEIGHWSVRPIDLTGNNQPEAVLTLYEDRSGASQKLDVTRPINNDQLYKPHTLIFSDAGTLLYNEFSKDAQSSLTAIADLGDGGSAALILNGSNAYNLKRWSVQRNRFE
ncbi:MAG: hypothetical protein F6K28_15265 [Microcoleus sp. SIO2G3]|nr:hypothetical protein [Microcoleus sp. SIO2G3]